MTTRFSWKIYGGVSIVACIVVWRLIMHHGEQIQPKEFFVSVTVPPVSWRMRVQHGDTVAHLFSRVHNSAPDENDRMIPPAATVLAPAMHVLFLPARRADLFVDGQKKEVRTTAATVGAILREQAISLDDDDTVQPSLTTTIADGGKIVVEHVITKEETKTITLAYETKEHDDDTRAFGTTTVTHKGKEGRAEITERVVVKGGKEVRRTEVRRTVLVAPEDRIVVHGTKVILGKKHTGQSSWYAYKDCNCAANPWLPMGSYAKVTNTANGKSVIVKINDRGPFVPGRIIDLDQKAFSKIASLGAGVITVTMEEVQ